MPETRSNRKVLVLPGDGIGPEIMREVMRVVEFFDRRHIASFEVSEAVLEEYLRTFAVEYAVLERPRPDFDRATRLLERLPDVGHRAIYRSKLSPSKLLRGGSGSVHASINRIGVAGTAPGEDIVLSYHWHERLQCMKARCLRRERFLPLRCD